MAKAVEQQHQETVELVVQFDVTEQAIAKLAEEFKDTAFDTPKAYEVGRLRIAQLRELRGKVEKRRVDLKAPALDFGRKVDAVAKVLTAKIEAVEEPLQALKKIVDEEEARKKREKERAELIALEAEQTRKREEAEAAAKKVREEEEKRLAAERERLAVEQARIDEEKRRTEEANKAIAEQQRLERERLDAEKATMETEKRKVAEQQAAAEREQRERDAKARAEEEKRAAAKRAEEEAARLAEMRPDIEKVQAFAGEIRALAGRVPKVTAEPCVAAVDWLKTHLAEVADDLEAFDGTAGS